MSITTAKPTARPLGAGRHWRSRLLRHHLPLAAVCAAALWLFVSVPAFADTGMRGDIMGGPLPAQFGDRGPMAGMNHAPGQGGGGGLISALTMSTGYVATLLLGLTLLVGPANLLLRRRHPISTPLARDIGIWSAAFSAVHVVFGFRLHGDASQLSTFYTYLFRDGVPRTNSFGIGNWVGLAALLIALLLLAISNDRALHDLKAKRWKSLQRLNYALVALVVVHAFFYGAFLQVTSGYTLLLTATATVVLLGQAFGIRLYRRRHLS
jgi:sulfoxide reductase heme-binding subunit YedZ